MAKHENVIAHRGASHARPENTLPAFEHAIELGADLLEFDVRLTADGHAIIMHDASVERTTNGTGAVRSLTLDEIRKLDAGLKYGTLYKDIPVPTLDEVLELARPSGVGLDVQIYATEDSRDGLTKAVVEALNRHEYDDRAFIAAEEDVVLLARELDPNRPICNLTGQRDAKSLDRNKKTGSTTVQAFAKYVTPQFVEKAHKMGIVVNVFYADHVNEMRRLIDCGVDGILTNEPEMLLRVLGRLPDSP